MIEKGDHGSAHMTYLGSHVNKSRTKIRITAVQRPCITRDGCRRRRIRSSIGRPGLGDAARFQHRFGVLTETFSQSLLPGMADPVVPVTAGTEAVSIPK